MTFVQSFFTVSFKENLHKESLSIKTVEYLIKGLKDCIDHLTKRKKTEKTTDFSVFYAL